MSTSDLPPPEQDDLLVAYEVKDATGWKITPAPYQRQWMEETPGRGAYRCLPLSMANQAGWSILGPVSFTAHWNGKPAPDSVRFEFDDDSPGASGTVMSHFGNGIVTFQIPFLFHTPPHVGLLVRGAPNWPITNFYALEGLVETDWNPATFTMNWKIMEPDRPARFEHTDPVVFIQPFHMDLPERLRAVQRKINDNMDARTEYSAWRQSRSEFLKSPEAARGDWQKEYFQGVRPGGERVEHHRLNFRLSEFRSEAAKAVDPETNDAK